jgi:hypothetical protein
VASDHCRSMKAVIGRIGDITTDRESVIVDSNQSRA